MSAALTPELLDLMEHEKVIEQGLATFLDVAIALLRIREGKKYRAAGYGTFDEYCRRRWEFTQQRATQLLRAAETVQALESGTNVSLPSPTSEGQVRPLTRLRKKPEKAREAWALAVEQADGDQPTAAQVEQAVAVLDAPAPLTKPDVGGGVSHPARFSDRLLARFAELLPVEHYRVVLDPFAGTGRVHELANRTIGIELEPEWATLHPDTREGDALTIMRGWRRRPVDAICTSPTYGNRLADHHDASDPERRRSYTHDLGRALHARNSGAMQWGDDYRTFHADAWRAAVAILRPGGRFVLNIKDHVRDDVVQPVALWHVATLVGLGLSFTEAQHVDARNLSAGDNSDLRCPEWVVVLDKP